MGRTQALAPLTSFLAHLLECAHTPLVARPSRLDALSDPHFLFTQLSIEMRGLHGFGFEVGFPTLKIGAVIAGPAVELSSFHFDNARGQCLRQGAVVVYEEEGAPAFEQELFEPGDGVNVEVVGWLVEKEKVGFAGQRASQKRPSFHAD